MSALQEAGRRLGYDYPVIHISQLKEAFRRAVGLFLKAASENEERVKRISERAGLWFSDIPFEIVDSYLSETKTDED